MSRPLAVRRSIALTGAFVLATWGAAALPAQADPGNGNSGSHAHHGKHEKKDQKDKKDNGHGPKSNSGQGNHGSHGSHGNGSQNNGGNGSQNKGEKSDPPGNNGTVKIAPYGEVDAIPNNTPHVDCHFQIEWYGFDEGDDIVSTVVFAMQAPTRDVVISGTEPSEVFVGGDPATGAGTETGFDGVQDYTLGFDGEPHAQQGYHVKLTIHTPGSQGADTKHKVFWVQPCAEETGGTTDEDADTEGDEESTESGSRGNDTEVLGEQASTSNPSTTTDDTEVMGAQAGAGNDVQAAAAKVPTAVDAGEEGNPVVNFVTSPFPLLLLGFGLAIGGAAFATRRSGAKS